MADRAQSARMPKKKIGRPSKYTPELVEVICTEIAHGRSLVSICKEDSMPDYATVKRWLNKHEAFRAEYARAREDQADYLADEIVAISDDGKNDTYVDEAGKVKTNWDVIGRSKLRVDARKWIAAKLRPKRWGDMTRHEVDATVDMTWAQIARRAAERERGQGEG